jgi:hypothetical protein
MIPKDIKPTIAPPHVQAWIKQLLDPDFIKLISAIPYDQIDIKLSASKGRVRRRPVVILNGGPTEYDKIG